MSLLIASLLKKNDILVEAQSGTGSSKNHRQTSWLISYIALFTSLLAFFILTISLLELETSVPKRNHQKLIDTLESQMQYQRDQVGIPWLNIEASSTKGIRISLPPDLVEGETLFASARAQINPRYLPYLRSMLEVMKFMDFAELEQSQQTLISTIETDDFELKFIWRIEGHTDANPMDANARFRNNVELSAFRAYAMMEWIRIHLGLQRDQFAIAGYGSFHPVTDSAFDAENRRIEIYLIPQLVRKNGREVMEEKS